MWQNDVMPLLVNLFNVKDITGVWPLLNNIASVTNRVKLNNLQLGLTFDGLRIYYNQLKNREKENFLLTIKAISSYAMKIQDLLPRDKIIKLSYKNQPGDVSVDRQLIACLLAHSFLCLHPTNNRSETFPEINFTGIFKNVDLNVEKITCLLKYFERLSAKNDEKFRELRNKNVVFVRIVTSKNHINWDRLRKSKKTLCKLIVDQNQLIEDTDKKYVRVDFANKYLGGGVLNTGCVQEEIMFTVCPELITGMLLMESMDENEAIVISGFEQYCKYSGYARSFKCKGDYCEQEEAERNYLVAIDALDYRSRDTNNQFKTSSMLREIIKAYTGFSKFSHPPLFSSISYPSAIATGNWGCGAFKGDPVLKSLLQWVAASEAGCSEMLYCSFSHQDLVNLKAFAKIFKSILEPKTVGDLAALLLQMAEEKPGKITYDYLIRRLNANIISNGLASIR